MAEVDRSFEFSVSLCLVKFSRIPADLSELEVVVIGGTHACCGWLHCAAKP